MTSSAPPPAMPGHLLDAGVRMPEFALHATADQTHSKFDVAVEVPLSC